MWLLHLVKIKHSLKFYHKSGILTEWHVCPTVGPREADYHHHTLILPFVFITCPLLFPVYSHKAEMSKMSEIFFPLLKPV